MRRNRTAILVIVLVLLVSLLSGCNWNDGVGDALANSSEQIGENQARLEAAIPTPSLTYSNERANIAKRATTFNDPNKLSYIYLLADNGVIVGFFTVKGKVSNVSSYLVPDEQVVRRRGSDWVLQAPDIDGSYGTNGEGVFWYTAEGTYLEWKGNYLLCDYPIKLAQQPLMLGIDKSIK